MIMSNNRMVWWVYVVKAVTDISQFHDAICFFRCLTVM